MASGAQAQQRDRAIQFGKYTLMSRIATGGMGELFLAQLRAAGGFEKLVVIKRILPHLTDQREFVDMFVAEARTAARITHPNVCQIYELGQVDGRYYMALEYLEGVPLADVMVARKRAPQLADLRLVVSLVSQAAEGLHHAHSLRGADGNSEQLVHRDVNPRNVFVTSAGVAKVLDFGIVKVRGALSQTSTGAVKGTYSYMSPEQLQGEPLDCTADIFSLGTIAWEAVVGRRLFKRGSDLLTWKAIVEESIPRPSQFRYDLPAELDEAIMRALARPRDMRYQSARELALALERAIKPLGAPYTTLAISAEIEKAFQSELAQQRERVFAAHKRQEADRLAGEPIEDWSEEAPDTRVADPDYGYLVDSIAGAKPVGPRRPPSEVPLHTPSEIHTLDEELPGVGVARPVRRGSSPPYAKKKKQASAAMHTADPFVGEVPPGFREAPWPPEVTPLSRSSASSPRVTGHELRGRSPWPMILALLVFGTGAAALAYVLKKDGMSAPAGDSAAAPVESGAATPTAAVAPNTPVQAAASAATANVPAADDPPSPIDDAPGQVASAIPGGAPVKNRKADPPKDEPTADTPKDEPKKDEPKKDDSKKDDDKEKARSSSSSSSKRDRDREKDRSSKSKDKDRDKEKEKEKEQATTTTATAKASSAPKGSGFLTINAEPYATVYVDGKKRGYTPVVRLPLPAGDHSIKLVSSGGQADRKMSVKVSSGQEVRKFVKW